MSASLKSSEMRRGRCCALAAWATIGARSWANSTGLPATSSPFAAPAKAKVQAQPRRTRTPRLATPLPPILDRRDPPAMATGFPYCPSGFEQPELDGSFPHADARDVFPDHESDAIPVQRDDLSTELLLVELR